MAVGQESDRVRLARWRGGWEGRCDKMAENAKEFISQLEAIRAAVSKTATLASILDDAWFKGLEDEIKARPGSGLLEGDPAGIIAALSHPLRGVDWFERDQKLLLENKASEIDAQGLLFLKMWGVDPLLTFLPLLDARLTALRGLPFKLQVIQAKFEQLRATRNNPAFRNHLFEATVLGDLALKGVLHDVEDDTTAVDGVIDIEGREILVEATNTMQTVVPEFTGVISLDPDREITQVVKKLRKKVADGRQIALAKGQPALLFLALTIRGADRVSARIAFQECFRDPDFAALSGVILAGSWRFQMTQWHPGLEPDNPLLEGELAAIEHWYAES